MNFNIKRFFVRLTNWEYWPFAAVYGPILPVYFWYALRSRSFFFFSTSNPAIKNAGFDMESKFEIDRIVPANYRPESVYFEPSTSFDLIQQKITDAEFVYPLIIKPDIGGKGRGVTKVYNAAELRSSAAAFSVPFIIQPFVDLENEIGLFFVKVPGSDKGKITGIVKKEFLKVTGDGIHSTLQLLQQNSRYLLQIPVLTKTAAIRFDRIIPAGETEILVPYGNHARGSLFLDHSHLVTPQLEATFNEVASGIKGFYYGRMDIRYNTWAELEAGKNFSIIELNGAGSEPTHIYDPQHSLFFAWKEIIRHWRLLWQVSTAGKRWHRLNYMSLREGLQMFKEKKDYVRKCVARPG
ncbi:hypothetical protein [Ferruginibacter sp. HRS2-29]|uniref:hypothetical protein n=1 Tax=Ferruginibacter sp. HRS2-29 TaxID=2487334 RepID=UPI0020CD2511|nr:hypothetical protein [Ferruginibacter sp. HRS2-29]MCP9753533.1 D-alanine--D-alanine ligase [Ferruginibacter sp. HRS2-29]